MNVKNICTVYDWIHQRDEIEKVKNKKLEEELIINKKNWKWKQQEDRLAARITRLLESERNPWVVNLKNMFLDERRTDAVKLFVKESNEIDETTIIKSFHMCGIIKKDEIVLSEVNSMLRNDINLEKERETNLI